MKISGLAVLAALLAASMLGSVMLGVTHIPARTVWESFAAYTGSKEHLIIQTTRVPRALIAAAVGGSLAVAGIQMQGITRNPLASPSLFGVNSGAVFFVVLASSLLGVTGLHSSAWVAFIGAAVSAAVVYLVGSFGRDGMTPVKITLAGAAITALFHSLTQGMLLADGKMFDQVLIWLVGSVAGRELGMLRVVAPYMLAGFMLAMILSRHMNVLAMGEDIAEGLGQRTALVKLGAAVSVVLLAGGSVAVAGPIAFVGIIIPHIVRHLVGQDYRWNIPYCFLMGALLLVAADLGSRYIAMPREVPVGVMTAILGVPFFVMIARKEVWKGHA
ncbi:FecCD family ABC transporter permease [Gorillibacterium sp. sgz5001074]|uniref:FecCD family ABC transporter permease n=1 Tax=Gorillibacterium sp. sgz5001074 TaxID=3446695 RepID=UPI003F66DC6A